MSRERHICLFGELPIPEWLVSLLPFTRRVFRLILRPMPAFEVQYPSSPLMTDTNA